MLYLLQRLQGVLPLNPQGLPGIESSSSFNTAASFTTNTNWQSYVPEVTMSYLTQMAGLAYQNCVSAAVGIALAIAFIRGIAQREKDSLGNFWVDFVRANLWVLLPFCVVGALVLVSQGMIQNLKPYDTVTLVDSQTIEVDKKDAAGTVVTDADGTNDGAHGFSEIIYAYASAVANNGQNFAGLSANSIFYNATTAIAMMIGRFGLAIPALALAGSFARQGRRPVTVGTLPTDSFAFGLLLVGTALIVGGLSYFPALAVGPVIEHFIMHNR